MRSGTVGNDEELVLEQLTHSGPCGVNSPSTSLSPSAQLRAGAKLDIFQINSHKSKNSNLSLRLHSEKYENAFYAVTEPYCDKYGNLKFIGSKELTVVKSDRTVIVDNNECKEKVRAAVIHSKHLPITPVTQHCSSCSSASNPRVQQHGRRNNCASSVLTGTSKERQSLKNW